MVDVKEIMLDILKRDGLINSSEYELALKEVRRRAREKELNKGA